MISKDFSGTENYTKHVQQQLKTCFGKQASNSRDKEQNWKIIMEKLKQLWGEKHIKQTT